MGGKNGGGDSQGKESSTPDVAPPPPSPPPVQVAPSQPAPAPAPSWMDALLAGNGGQSPTADASGALAALLQSSFGTHQGPGGGGGIGGGAGDGGGGIANQVGGIGPWDMTEPTHEEQHGNTIHIPSIQEIIRRIRRK